MKTFKGVVLALKSEKTATVEVENSWKHPLYEKIVKRTKKYPSHYEDIKLKVGDLVVIQEGRPISKNKRFKVIEVITQGKA
jgi:small subunit ribosomal protein S17